MFRLKSNALQREFKVNEGYLYASRIRNTRSGMDLVPDGNSTEFTFHFTDGTEFSSKGLKVTDSAERDGKLVFTFEEFEGITVTMRYWVGRDGNTLKKQLQFIQATEDKVIDYIALEHIGVINSQTHFSIPDDVETSMQIPDAMAILGQPFYIDSLFFGCEFPATDNRIQYGIGQVKYYVGHPVHGRFTCPATVMAAPPATPWQRCRARSLITLNTSAPKATSACSTTAGTTTCWTLTRTILSALFMRSSRGLAITACPHWTPM